MFTITTTFEGEMNMSTERRKIVVSPTIPSTGKVSVVKSPTMTRRKINRATTPDDPVNQTDFEEKYKAMKEEEQKRLVKKKYAAEVSGEDEHRTISVTPITQTSTLKKKERFEDRHNRVTTYINKMNHNKLNEIRTEYRIPISDTVNKALNEYFMKHGI